jgi:C_GCAxxG_C_C family probable redox protein
MTNPEKASSTFNAGYNCSQSVLIVYAEKFGMDNITAIKLASGFGGGMARMQEICGAIAGGLMTLGLAYSHEQEDPATNKERVYHFINLFIQKFKEKHGTIKCRELLNCDLNTEEGQAYYNENKLQQNVCANCVKDAVEILDDFLERYKQ